MVDGAPGMAEQYRVLALQETASTNAEAMRLVLAGEPGGLWVVAERQTAGRGRSGRTWSSLPGNLHASLMLRDLIPLERTYQLALVAGVACHDAVRAALASRGQELLPGSLALKWPNDLLLASQKLAGILVEGSTQRSGNVAVIGVGVNIANVPDGMEATSLAAHHAAITPAEMLAFLSRSMQEWVAIWDTGAGFAAIRTAWTERGLPVGTPMTVKSAVGPEAGHFAGLADDGGLILDRASGGRATFTYGDVTL